jgi:hypothetical protein
VQDALAGAKYSFAGMALFCGPAPPLALAVGGIALVFDVPERQAGQRVGDPPDPNFRTIARLREVELPKARAGQGLSRRN